MKSKIKQILTVVGFFTSAISSILVISWGVTNIVFTDNINKTEVVEFLSCNVKNDISVDLKKSFKYLIPKIK